LKLSLGTLLGLAWPIIISRSTQVVIGVCDAVMVAGLGEAALAATTAGALNTVAVMVFPMGVSFIVSSYASQLFGKKDLSGARRYGVYGLLLAALTQLLGMLCVLITPAILSYLPYAPDVRRLMTEYLQIRLFSAGAAIGIEALGNYYGGLNKTWYAMATNVGLMLINLVGNYALIGGHLGAPALGVNGAALSNTISTWIAFLGFLGAFLYHGRSVKAGALSFREMARMLRFGIPSGLNWFFEFFAFNLFVNVVVAGLGTTALAAMMSVLQINSVSFMPAFGIASAGAILVGQAIGAGSKDSVPRIVRITFLASATWQGAVAISYLIMPAVLFLPFASGAESPELLRIGTRMLMLSAMWQLFDSAAAVLAEALRAAGDTAFTLWARLVLAWLIFMPGSYVTVRYLNGGELGAVAWLTAYMGMLAGALVWRFRSGAWRRLELVEPSLVG
jgi:multidrug resistance protein, MATE family